MNVKCFFRKVISRVLYPIRPYWTANIYGFGKWIRRYGYYPSVLPLCIYTDHGPGDAEASPFPHELEASAPVQFYHAGPAVERWKKVSSRPCYVLYSPFVFARKILKRNYNPNAKGTIYFVAHSTPSIDDNKPAERYHNEIANLPEKYHPVTICLHIHDVRAGMDMAYKKLGYTVVTAGDSLDQRFTEKFYALLTQHKYALSNIFGSYALYATEMGMPFGLYGSDPEYVNHNDANVEKGAYTSYKNGPYYRQAVELFGALPGEAVTPQQKAFAESNLGLHNGISRGQMARVLYKSLFVWLGDRLKIRGPKMSISDRILDLSLRKIFRRAMQAAGLRGGADAAHYAGMGELLGQEQAKWVAALPRFTPGEVSIGPLSLAFNDNVALLGMLDEIFIRKNYAFTAATDAPVIIDCGANIGVGVAYFKMRYPNAEIHAFEPDTAAFNCLAENVKRNGFQNVHLHQKAVWVRDEALEFYADGSWGGGIFAKPGAAKHTVQAVDIAAFLDRRIDFLKIDIEGAETQVIRHAREKILRHVERLFFEWHSMKDSPQQLGALLGLFEASGFRYHIKEAAQRNTPFENIPGGAMDSQLDVFLQKM